MAHAGRRHRGARHMRDAHDADALPAACNLHWLQPDVFHRDVGGELIYFSPHARMAEAWTCEFRVPADPGGLHSGGRGHDRLWIDLAAESFADRRRDDCARRGRLSFWPQEERGRGLVRRVPAMLLAEFRVDRLTPGKTFLRAVPKADACLTQLPAEVDFVAAEQSGEIDEPNIQIFNQAAGLLNFLDGGLEALGALVPAQTVLIYGGAVHQHAAQHDHALVDGLKRGLGLFQFGFRRDGFTDALFDFGEKAFCLLEREASRHDKEAGQPRGVLNARHLDGHRAAAWTLKLSQKNPLPGAQQHRRAAHLEEKT